MPVRWRVGMVQQKVKAGAEHPHTLGNVRGTCRVWQKTLALPIWNMMKLSFYIDGFLK